MTQPIKMTQLLNGFRAPTTFYHQIQIEVSKGISKMDSNHLYTLKELCDKSFWDALPNSKKWLAGRCFAHMVSEKIFHLRFVKYKRSPTKRYQMI